MSNDPSPQPAARNFVPILSSLRKGEAVHELNEQLKQLVAAVKSTGKAGKLVLTLTVEKVKGAQRGIMIESVVTTKLPVLPKSSDVFFSDDQAGLHRSDPNQDDMFQRPRLSSPPANPPAEGQSASA